MTKEVRYRGVSRERELNLIAFATALEKLCADFRVDLYASTESQELIEISERDFPYPDGYSFSATFTEVTERGVRNGCNRRRGLYIDRWWYKDVPSKSGKVNG